MKCKEVLGLQCLSITIASHTGCSRLNMIATGEIEKSCRFDIEKASSSDINLLKQLYKLGMKLCTICDHFDIGNKTCQTVGVCPQTAVCYRGYNNDYSSHNTGILSYQHPHAVSHGCCKPSSDKNCHYHYRYKVSDSKHHALANYTLYTCTTGVCNRDYAIHTKMSAFYDKILDGGWTSWSHWSSCSQTCGTAHVSRHRSCTNPTPKYGGHSCSGSSSETKTVTCHTSHCPRNGHWGSWSSYSECSKTCGVGHKTRHRSCNHPSPAYGGSSCHGSSSVSTTCNTQPCPVDGSFTPWSNWSACSRTCLVGQQSRTRSCTAPAPAHGGKNCMGSVLESQSCDKGACPVWSTWFYGQCSVTCGNGTTDRIRHCSSGHDEDCPGIAIENVACSNGPCPIDGAWGSWGSWTSCSSTCGGGQRSRSRQCNNPAPQFNGASCPEAGGETENCNTQHCPVWSDYFEVSPCSVICGNGVIMLRRNCSYGTHATDCVGSPYNEKPCTNSPCV